jgi:hypothetical protein
MRQPLNFSFNIRLLSQLDTIIRQIISTPLIYKKELAHARKSVSPAVGFTVGTTITAAKTVDINCQPCGMAVCM